MIGWSLATVWAALACWPQEEVDQSRLGPEKGWQDTIAGAWSWGSFYTLDRSGSLFLTSLEGVKSADGVSGQWKDARLLAGGNTVWGLHKDGSLSRRIKGDLRSPVLPGTLWADVVGMAGTHDRCLLMIDRKGVLHQVSIDFSGDLDRDEEILNQTRLTAEGGWKDVAAMTFWRDRVWAVDGSGTLLMSDQTWKGTALGKPGSHAGTRWMGPSSSGLVTVDQEGSLYKTDLWGNRRRIGKAGLVKDAQVLASEGSRDTLWWISSTGTLTVTELIPRVQENAQIPWNALGLDQLKALFLGLDATIRTLDESTGQFEAKISAGGTQLYIDVDMNSDGRFIWLTLHLGGADPRHLKKAPELLKRNDAIQPCQFYINAGGELKITLPVQNRRVTGASLKKAVELLGRAVDETADVWGQSDAEKK